MNAAMRAALVFALLCLPLLARAEPPPFDRWLADLKAEAAKRGHAPHTLQALETLLPIPEVIEKDRHQPESRMTFAQYRALILTDTRIANGRQLYATHKAVLDEIGEKYGVDPHFIVALWGVESAYGTRTGDFPVVGALATLAYDGRRAAFFRRELFAALRILDEGHIAADAMKGSWAGAMGQCQFMPSTFLRHAADGNGDGKKDIWGTLPDVFASAAQYLSRIGWQADVPWGQEVRVPDKVPASLENRKLAKTLTQWRALGVRTADGKPLPRGARRATLVRPGGNDGPAYLVHRNYHALLDWNRSKYFATAVSLLADEIARP